MIYGKKMCIETLPKMFVISKRRKNNNLCHISPMTTPFRGLIHNTSLKLFRNPFFISSNMFTVKTVNMFTNISWFDPRGNVRATFLFILIIELGRNCHRERVLLLETVISWFLNKKSNISKFIEFIDIFFFKFLNTLLLINWY